MMDDRKSLCDVSVEGNTLLFKRRNLNEVRVEIPQTSGSGSPDTRQFVTADQVAALVSSAVHNAVQPLFDAFAPPRRAST